MSDLDRLHQRLAPPRLNEIKRFREVGVSPEALSSPELPARADVVFHDDRPLFDFVDEIGDGGAIAGFIFLARDDEGDPCDLVAWSPQAKRIAAWYGVAPLLGTDMLYAPRLDPEGALQVFEEPLAWLLEERAGVVIVDPVRAAPILRAAEPLKASSAAFGLRLRDLIAPRRPRIFVPQGRAA
jgi:hypothetical protein